MKITDSNTIGMGSKGRKKKIDEILNDLKKLKLKKWTNLVKDRKRGMNSYRRPKPTKGCSVSSSRRKKKVCVTFSTVVLPQHTTFSVSERLQLCHHA
jgi:hypothetical protein